MIGELMLAGIGAMATMLIAFTPPRERLGLIAGGILWALGIGTSFVAVKVACGVLGSLLYRLVTLAIHGSFPAF
jgi:hypothetical protein